MKILQANPSNLHKILKAGLKPSNKTIFTYGDTIYNPSGEDIGPLLMKHEETHSRQQGNDPEEWWAKYLESTDFRLEQELEAYQSQYRAAKSIVRDRNKLFNFLKALATDLSGEMYGNVLTFQDAITKIKNAKDTSKR